MGQSDNRPVHISNPGRARPPSTEGETIVSRFEDIGQVLEAARKGDSVDVRVDETERTFEVRANLGGGSPAARVDNGLIHVENLDAGDGDTTRRSFTVPDDLEADLVTAQCEGATLIVTLPRTNETTRIVRHIQGTEG